MSIWGDNCGSSTACSPNQRITDYSETETFANKPKEQIFVAGANVTFQLMAINKIADFFSEAWNLQLVVFCCWMTFWCHINNRLVTGLPFFCFNFKETSLSSGFFPSSSSYLVACFSTGGLTRRLQRQAPKIYTEVQCTQQKKSLSQLKMFCKHALAIISSQNYWWFDQGIIAFVRTETEQLLFSFENGKNFFRIVNSYLKWNGCVCFRCLPFYTLGWKQCILLQSGTLTGLDYAHIRKSIIHICYNVISKRHPSTSFPSAKHPKHHKLKVLCIRKKNSDFISCH